MVFQWTLFREKAPLGAEARLWEPSSANPSTNPKGTAFRNLSISLLFPSSLHTILL